MRVCCFNVRWCLKLVAVRKEHYVTAASLPVLHIPFSHAAKSFHGNAVHLRVHHNYHFGSSIIQELMQSSGFVGSLANARSIVLPR